VGAGLAGSTEREGVISAAGAEDKGRFCWHAPSNKAAIKATKVVLRLNIADGISFLLGQIIKDAA
jgi:hypothetical protein